MTRVCWDTTPHRCYLGRHILPDLTGDPEDQTTAQRVVGVVILLALFALVALVPGR